MKTGNQQGQASWASRGTGRKTVAALAVCGLLLLATSAFAKPHRLQTHSDGSVTVDGVRFDDMASFHRSRKFRAEGWRCGTRTAPITVQAVPSDCTLASTSILAEYDPGAVFEVVVVFHIAIGQNGDGAISDELIQSQMDVLNEDFSALANTPGAPGTFSAIRFSLATVDANGQPTTGIKRYVNDDWFAGDDVAMAFAVAWDPTRYLNIYTIDAGGALGWATLPQDSAGTALDSVTIHWSAVGRNAPFGGDFDQGRTATHEVGHYLGLFHTFDGGCGSVSAPYTSGDLIGDTVAEFTSASVCVEAPGGCGAGNAPIHNYMNYTNDTCLDHFTGEQINRMRCSTINYRPVFTNQLPAADFSLVSASSTQVTLTDASTDADGTIAAWAWNFGDGTRSTEQNPTHDYGRGTYQISLVVTDDRGGQSSAVREVVTNQMPTASFTVDVDGLSARLTDTSRDPDGTLTGWLWEFGDQTRSGLQMPPTHDYATAGTYTVTLTVTDDSGTTSTTTGEVTVADGGCGCRVAGGARPSRTSWLGFLAFGLTLVLLRRRRRTRNSAAN